MGSGVPMLGLDNWPAWSPKMRALLTLHECVEAILPTPRDGPARERLREHQQELAPKNEKARALMTLKVSEVHQDAMALPTAKQCWEALEATCMQQGQVRRFALKDELGNLQMLPDERMGAYLGRAFRLFTDLQTVGAPVSDEDKQHHVLRGLPPMYSTDRRLLSMQGVLPLPDLKLKLLQAEHLQREEEKHTGAANIAARPQQQQHKQKQQQGSRGRGSRGGGGGGGREGSSMGQQGGGELVPGTDGRKVNKECYRCKRWGHFQDHCPSSKQGAGTGSGDDAAAGVSVLSVA